MSNTITGDDVADEADKKPPRRGHQKDDSKEETGRDTPRPYATIVGGEGQDFVATTLSTAAQVMEQRLGMSSIIIIIIRRLVFWKSALRALPARVSSSLSGDPLTRFFVSQSVCLDANRSKRPCKKCNPRAR